MFCLRSRLGETRPLGNSSQPCSGTGPSATRQRQQFGRSPRARAASRCGVYLPIAFGRREGQQSLPYRALCPRDRLESEPARRHSGIQHTRRRVPLRRRSTGAGATVPQHPRSMLDNRRVQRNACREGVAEPQDVQAQLHHALTSAPELMQLQINGPFVAAGSMRARSASGRVPAVDGRGSGHSARWPTRSSCLSLCEW